MLIGFNNRNIGQMADGELTFARRLSVSTRNNSLGKLFLLDLICLREGSSGCVQLVGSRP